MVCPYHAALTCWLQLFDLLSQPEISLTPRCQGAPKMLLTLAPNIFFELNQARPQPVVSNKNELFVNWLWLCTPISERYCLSVPERRITDESTNAQHPF